MLTLISNYDTVEQIERLPSHITFVSRRIVMLGDMFILTTYNTSPWIDPSLCEILASCESNSISPFTIPSIKLSCVLRPLVWFP